MCCIIYKPKGVQMPSLDILAKIKKLNRNGYGFVSTNHFHKGLDYRTFLRHLSEVGDDEDCILHFRLATNGSICRANCHPFVENGVYFAHNGVLNVYPVGDMTDSEIAFRTMVYPAIKKYGYGSQDVYRLINSIIGYSKFALMYRGEVRLYGDYTKINGVYYSNLRWL
jgi:hypothetical protein